MYVDRLQASGRYTFTKPEALRALRCSEAALKQAALRLARKWRLSSPRRGFFVVVPLEYRSAGAPPPSWYIDTLMKHEGRPYYVGLLSAAALFGAAHQQPQEFQVITDQPLRTAEAGRSRIHFYSKRDLERSATLPMKTETGEMVVSTPEITAFDLVKYAHACGGLSNVATVLAELRERLDVERLVDAARTGVEVTTAQRLGYLLDRVGGRSMTGPLLEWTVSQRPRLARLRPDLDNQGGERDERWRLVVNDELEVDV